MTLTIKLVSVIALASFATSSTLRPANRRTQQDDYQPSESVLESRDSYQPYQPQLPLDFQLPKLGENPVPFYASEPVEYVQAPNENQEPNYYQVPIPAQELLAPVEVEWNPSNDPKLYYEVPVAITKQQLPTNAYPKKFNTEIHSKTKPYSTKPKQEITLQPIDEKQYETKQKELHQVFQKLAKKENQKLVQAQKAQPTVQV